MSDYGLNLRQILLVSLAVVAMPLVFGVGQTQAQEATAGVTDSSLIIIQKLSKFDFANPNTDIDYQVVVTNAGPLTIANIVMTDTWPGSFVVNGSTGGFVTWLIPSLSSGQSVIKDLRLHVPAETRAANYSSKTMFISQQPAIQKTLDFNLEVRSVTILSSKLPTTDGFSSMYLYAGALLLQLSIIASLSFNKYLRL